MQNHPRVVFLANDAVFGQALAFLESFRTFNPSIMLSMIPFASDISNLKKIMPIYNFDILEFDVERWDDLSKLFFPGALEKHLHRLRKLSIFDADASATIYLDLDMVVLKDLSFLAQPIIDGSADFICTATGNDPWVYNTSYKTHPLLKDAKRFSDGFFAFNPRKINASVAYDTVVANEITYRSVRASEVYCQPVTNFIIDILGLNVKEVFRLFPNISPQVWYGSENLSFIDNKVISKDGKEVLFIHWAGPVNMKQDFRFKELYESYLSKGKMHASSCGVDSVLL